MVWSESVLVEKDLKNFDQNFFISCKNWTKVTIIFGTI